MKLFFQYNVAEKAYIIAVKKNDGETMVYKTEPLMLEKILNGIEIEIKDAIIIRAQ